MADVAAIERSIDQDRESLVQSLAQLRGRLRPSELMAQGKAAVRDHAQPLIGRFDHKVRSRPVIASVAALALAALFLGRRVGQKAGESADTPALAGTKFEAVSRWEGEGGQPTVRPLDPDEGWLTEATGLHRRAMQLLGMIDDAVARGVVPPEELARDRADVLRALADDVQRALERGLEPLTGSARDHAFQAREALYRRRISEVDRSPDRLASHPVAVGLMAAVAGAVLAYLVPRTDAEDRLFGTAKDTLVRDLKAALQDEAARASDFARILSGAVAGDEPSGGRAGGPVNGRSAPNGRLA